MKNCEKCIWDCKHEMDCDYCSDFTPEHDGCGEEVEDAREEYRMAWHSYVRDFE